MADVGYPVRGGQTLLIAYFPWEASEADIEQEFSKISRVKRVHLVVDKSSRKPRCFGFVKFMSKADAEEALLATSQGLVQLPDTRGHVWHVKAEWTKSGDMVVDDSDAEIEVAKRREERKLRGEQCLGGPNAELGGPDSGRCCAARAKVSVAPERPNGGKTVAVPPKGALHPGVPAPLPPLQRMPITHFPYSLQGQMPMVQHSHSHMGLVGSLGAAVAQHPPPLAHQAFGGVSSHMQHSLPLYSGQPGLPSGTPLFPNGLGPQVDALGSAGFSQQVPRDLLGGYAPHGLQSQHQPLQHQPPQRSHSIASQLPGYTQQCHAFAQPSYFGGPHSFGTNQPPYGAVTAGYAPQAPQGFAPQQGYGAPAAGFAHGGTTAGYQSYGPGHQVSSQPVPGVAQTAAHAGAFSYLQQPIGPSSPVGPLAYAGCGGPQPPGVLPQCAAHPSPDRNQASTLSMPSAPVQCVPGARDAQYLDVVWNLSEMSLSDEAGPTPDAGAPVPPGDQPLPAPPAQQPPAPPSGHIAAPGQWQMEVASGAAATGSGPTHFWNSFDDAAAKGMVDGLVGGEEGGGAPGTASWPAPQAA